LDRAAVSNLQAFFFVGLRESFVGLAVLGRQKQVNGFPKFPCYIVLDLGVRVVWLPWRPLEWFCAVIQAGQVDYCVAAPDQSAEHFCQRAVSQCKRALLDRENLEAQERVFDFAAITAEVACGRRDEHFRVLLSHSSLEILSNSRAGSEQKG